MTRELISFCFKGREKQLIAVTQFSATWADDKNKCKYNLTDVSINISKNTNKF